MILIIAAIKLKAHTHTHDTHRRTHTRMHTHRLPMQRVFQEYRYLLDCSQCAPGLSTYISAFLIRIFTY